MSKIGESICLALNSLFRKYPSYTSEGETYAQAQQREITDQFDAYYGKYGIDLKDKVVLDAGCGTGGKTVYYAKMGCQHIYGIDREDVHIEISEKYAAEQQVKNASFRIEDLEDMDFESNMFDVIFLNGVLEHIVREKLRPAMADMKRVLKPNGRLLIEFPPWTSPYAAHLQKHIYIPWCHYLFSDETLCTVTDRLSPHKRSVSTSDAEHFMELNRCTAAEFKQMVADLDYEVIDIQLGVVRKKDFLKHIPFFGKFFLNSVHAVLSKKAPCPAKRDLQGV